MELFLVFSVAAAFLFASASLLSKHFLDIGVEDHVFVGSIFGWPFFGLFMALGLYKGGVVMETVFAASSFAAGALYSLILMLYLKGLHEQEASRFIPTLALNTVFLAILSFIFLGQGFSLIEYLGIGLTVLGAILMSLENPLESLKDFNSKLGVVLAVIVAALIAVRDLLLDFATLSFDIWPALLWMGLGGLAFSLSVLLISRRDKLNYSAFRDSFDMLGVGFVRSTGFLSYAIAISLGPATKASAVLKLNGMLVFLGATLIALVKPGYIEEEVDGWKVPQKFIASALIIVGVLLVR